MLRTKNIILVVILLTLSATTIYASLYVPNNRDTSPNPEEILVYSTELQQYPNEYVLMYETDTTEYYYREDRDVFAMKNKETGHIWKTGLDVPFKDEIRDFCDLELEEVEQEGINQGLTDEEIDALIIARAEEVCEPYENRLNTTYVSLANSLITIEVIDESTFSTSKYSSSIYYGDEPENVDYTTVTTSQLYDVVGEDNHKVLEVLFNEVDIYIKVHVYFTDMGIEYEIRDEEISGEGQNLLHSIIFTPFMGASGGQKTYWNPENKRYNIILDNEMIPGYVLVPDGSGGLIRFRDNNTKITNYEGDVYGVDWAQALERDTSDPSYVPLKNPSAPLFGISHGDSQFAFLAYATSGGEYMEINVEPEEVMTYYTYAFPKFEFVDKYAKIYNQLGWGYQSLFEERNHYDIKMSYDILENADYSSDYVGMAHRYKDYLVENELLNLTDFNYENVPLHVDFLMSDVEESIIGYSNVVVTNIEDVDNILSSIYDYGITNINVGLLGWQDGGVTTGQPWATDFTRAIGTKGQFEDVIAKYNEIGIDISFIQDYFKFNEEQTSVLGKAAKHISSWYMINYASIPNIPIYEFYYARPYISVEWAANQISDLNKLGVDSYTVYGITNNLISDYSRDYNSVTDTIRTYREFFSSLDSNKLINGYRPNDYLWEFIDRYIDTPVFTSQFIIESDTVPFLQLVLNDSMELYAPYSNFSFYTQDSILRMIDYNVYPSFILTEESPHLLKDTNSNSYYSTQYNQYEDMILNIYGQVNDALNNVIGAEWMNREVYEPGVIINYYSNDIKIIINYTDESKNIDGDLVNPLSYKVLEVD